MNFCAENGGGIDRPSYGRNEIDTSAETYGEPQTPAEPA
jgi:hypothetical protein